MKRICDLTNSASNVEYTPSLRDNPPPLVPVERIQNATNMCPNGLNGCHLLELDPSTILKVGWTVQMGEAEAMILVKNQTSVPVPRVYNAYTIEDVGFILMEKIKGNMLRESLPGPVKESVARQLGDYIRQWRQIKGPYFGAVNGGPCQDIIFQHSWENVERHYGPFASRKEFNEGMVEALKKSRPNSKLETESDVLYAKHLLESGLDQEEVKVLTHGDLHGSNIMIQDGIITGIIDWGAAGYSVPEREYFSLVWPSMDIEWRELAPSILSPDGYDYWEDVNRHMKLYTCI